MYRIAKGYVSDRLFKHPCGCPILAAVAAATLCRKGGNHEIKRSETRWSGRYSVSSAVSRNA
jgi:hypothetical protein